MLKQDRRAEWKAWALNTGCNQCQKNENLPKKKKERSRKCSLQSNSCLSRGCARKYGEEEKMENKTKRGTNRAAAGAAAKIKRKMVKEKIETK